MPRKWIRKVKSGPAKPAAPTDAERAERVLADVTANIRAAATTGDWTKLAAYVEGFDIRTARSAEIVALLRGSFPVRAKIMDCWRSKVGQAEELIGPTRLRGLL